MEGAWMWHQNGSQAGSCTPSFFCCRCNHYRAEAGRGCYPPRPALESLALSPLSGLQGCPRAQLKEQKSSPGWLGGTKPVSTWIPYSGITTEERMVIQSEVPGPQEFRFHFTQSKKSCKTNTVKTNTDTDLGGVYKRKYKNTHKKRNKWKITK